MSSNGFTANESGKCESSKVTTPAIPCRSAAPANDSHALRSVKSVSNNCGLPTACWTCPSPRYSCSISAARSSPSLRSSCPAVSVADSRTRIGTVLRNSPMASSMPGSSSGCTDIGVPSTTSALPVAWPSTMPRAAVSTVLTVTPCSAAHERTRSDSAAPSVVRIRFELCVQTRSAPPAT